MADQNQTRFRGIRALYGQAGFEKLQNSTVTVLGVGGIGSWLTEALCRSGVGHLILIDPDTIEVGNSNRQSHTLSSTLGQLKAEVLAARLRDINPLVQVEVRAEILTSDNVGDLLKDARYAADAIDDIKAKAAAVNYLYQHKAVFMSAGGAGGRIDPAKIQTGDLSEAHGDALLRRLRNELRKHYGFPKLGKKMGIHCTFSAEKPTYSAKSADATTDLPVFGAAMAVTATAGLNIAAWLLRQITSSKN